MKIGIIGQGFVGTALREKFKKDFDVITYDKMDSKNSQSYTKDTSNDTLNTLTDIVKDSDVIFLCVPTPMFEDGKCDTSIVETMVDEVAQEAELHDKNVVIILKSTVPPGTTNMLNGISDKVGVTFSPEFLTEANAVSDFENQTRIVLGIDFMEYVEPIRSIFEKSFPKGKIILLNSKEAEMVKYTTNLFLATKVSFFNDIYSFCESQGIDYDDVVEATMHDPRIGKSHFNVPGPDGDRGFGGHCFPKDLNAILYIASEKQLAIPTITGTQITNMIVRKNRDWEQMEGRAITKNKEE